LTRKKDLRYTSLYCFKKCSFPFCFNMYMGMLCV
jgi:hypothetical protein